jgi:hypothetical protein
MTTFDPNSITPSDELMSERNFFAKHSNATYEDIYIFFARWGAEQAVEALKYQWPEPLTRPVTEADADADGAVQRLENGRWTYCHWRDIREMSIPWLHTPNWQLKPEPTLQIQALNILEDSMGNTRGDGWAEISPDNVRKLRKALLSIPGEVSQAPHIRDGNIYYTWKE